MNNLNLTATAGNRQVALAWNTPTFTVWRKRHGTSDSFAPLATTTETRYVDLAVLSGVAYDYELSLNEEDDAMILLTHIVLLTPGVNYRLGADFSAAGSFENAGYVAQLNSDNPAVIIHENENSKTVSKAFWTLYLPSPSSPPPPPVSVTLSGLLVGELQGTAQATSPVNAAWDAPTAF